MVGQFENCLTPSRTAGSVSTLMPLNLMPSSLSTSTTAAEKPHCGKTGVPFMKSTTSFSAMSCLMRSMTVASVMMLASGGGSFGRGIGSIGRRGLQRQRVQLVAHLTLQSLVDHLVLLHPC